MSDGRNSCPFPLDNNEFKLQAFRLVDCVSRAQDEAERFEPDRPIDCRYLRTQLERAGIALFVLYAWVEYADAEKDGTARRQAIEQLWRVIGLDASRRVFGPTREDSAKENGA